MQQVKYIINLYKYKLHFGLDGFCYEDSFSFQIPIESLMCVMLGFSNLIQIEFHPKNKMPISTQYGSGHGDAAVLLPSFAISW